jgi:hypothetical protein
VAKQQGGEFELTDPTTRTQDAEFQERGVRPKISLNPRHDLQHIQLPMPPHLSKNAPSLSGLNHADVARSHRRRVISAVEPGKPASNFQQYDNANTVHTFRKAKIQHSVIVMALAMRSGGLGFNHIGRPLFTHTVAISRRPFAPLRLPLFALPYLFFPAQFLQMFRTLVQTPGSQDSVPTARTSLSKACAGGNIPRLLDGRGTRSQRASTSMGYSPLSRNAEAPSEILPCAKEPDMLRFCTTQTTCSDRTLTLGEGLWQDKSRTLLGGRMGKKSRNNNVHGKGAHVTKTLVNAIIRWEFCELDKVRVARHEIG